MSDAAANKALLELVYRRWHESKGGAIDELMHVFADTVTFGSLADGAEAAPFTATAIGKHEVKGYFDGLLGAWSMIHFTVDVMIAEGDRVAVVCSTAWTNKATGKVCETPKVDVWRFENGRAISFFEYFDTARMFAAATA